MLYYFLLLFNVCIELCYSTHAIVQCSRWLTDCKKIIAFYNCYGNITSRESVEIAAYFNCFFIMDENDALSEYNKIPLGHNRTNGAVYSKIYFKVGICSAH